MKAVQDTGATRSPLRVVFFCGANSPYGIAHLEPLIRERRFRVAAVVLATRERWQKFSKALSGEDSLPTSPFAVRLMKHVVNLCKDPSPSAMRSRLRHLAAITRRPRGGTERALETCRVSRIPVWLEHDVNRADFVEKLSALEPDLVFSAAYPQIFNSSLLGVPRVGALNSHPSMLPRFRGAHPIFWAIAMGEAETGVTVHYMESKIDTGPIVAQVRFPVTENDTYLTVYQKATDCVPRLVSQVADFLNDGACNPEPQEQRLATVFREDRSIHHVIFWSSYSAEQIRNLVRAANGRAFFWFNGKRIYVLRCNISQMNRNLTNGIQVPPGTIVDCRGGVNVKVRDGVVAISEWKSEYDQKVSFDVGQVLR